MEYNQAWLEYFLLGLLKPSRDTVSKCTGVSFTDMVYICVVTLDISGSPIHAINYQWGSLKYPG